MGSGTSKNGYNGNPDLTPQSTYLNAFEGHRDSITCILISDRTLFTGSRDGTARSWNLKSVKRNEYIHEFKGHTFWIECLEVVDRFLFTGSADNTIRAWNTKSGKCVQVYKGHQNDVTQIVVKGKTLYSSSRDGTMRVWNVEKGEVVLELKGHSNWIECFRVSGTYLFSGSYDKTAKMWNIDSGECSITFEGHTGNIQCLEVDDLNDAIYTGSWDESVIVWSISTGEEIHRFKGHHGAITCMKLHKGNLYTGSKDTTLRRWLTVLRYQTKEQQNVYRGHTAALRCLHVSEPFMYSGAQDSVVRAWLIETGECIRVYRGHTNPVSCVMVVRDVLVSGSDDKRVLAWKIIASKDQLKNGIRGKKKSISLPGSPVSGSPPDTVRLSSPSDLNRERIFESQYSEMEEDDSAPTRNTTQTDKQLSNSWNGPLTRPRSASTSRELEPPNAVGVFVDPDFTPNNETDNNIVQEPPSLRFGRGQLQPLKVSGNRGRAASLDVEVLQEPKRDTLNFQRPQKDDD